MMFPFRFLVYTTFILATALTVFAGVANAKPAQAVIVNPDCRVTMSQIITAAKKYNVPYNTLTGDEAQVYLDALYAGAPSSAKLFLMQERSHKPVHIVASLMGGVVVLAMFKEDNCSTPRHLSIPVSVHRRIFYDVIGELPKGAPPLTLNDA